MPTYVYKREDGTTFETQQRITENALETCPDTGQAVQRVIQPAASHFKGSGFYLTDYVRNGKAGKAAKAENGSSEKKESAGGEASASSESKAPKDNASEDKSTKTKENTSST